MYFPDWNKVSACHQMKKDEKARGSKVGIEIKLFEEGSKASENDDGV